jgi:hypothetical protein
MISYLVLEWLQLFSQAYIVLPLLLVISRWRSHDAFRRRVGWFILFNAAFPVLSWALFSLFDNNMPLFYLASPVLVMLIYRLFDVWPSTSATAFWKIIRGLVVAYCLFVVVDVIWLENPMTTFSTHIYPPEKLLIVLMAFYFLYQFSREAHTDFSSLWIGIGIGTNALFTLMILIYSPYLSLQANTIGFFMWYGLASFVSILTYSFYAYGLWIYRSYLQQPRSNRLWANQPR